MGGGGGGGGAKNVTDTGPRVSDVFCTKGGRLGPRVSDAFCTKGCLSGPPVSDVTFLHHHGFSRWFHDFHGFWLVSMVFQGGFMVFGWFPWFSRWFHCFFMDF